MPLNLLLAAGYQHHERERREGKFPERSRLLQEFELGQMH